MPRRVCLIVNPSAGGGRAARVLPDVERELRGLCADVRTEATRDLDHARRLAADAAPDETIVTLGGDGLVGAVADVLRSRPGAVMGILPGGRGNDLVRVLGIPRDPLAACHVITDGVERALDLGEVNGRAFVSIASAGFDSEANRIANEAPSRLGQLVYAYGALRALAFWKPVRMQIELDPPNTPLVFDVYSVAVANSKAYGGGMWLAPDADMQDGQLDVVVTERVSRLRFLTNLPRVFRGTHVRLPSVHVFRAAQVRVSCTTTFDLYADGDPIAELPVLVRALPAAVRVLVPGPAIGSP